MTRKEIAALIEVSCMHVARNETILGLDKTKIRTGRRFIRYKRQESLQALRDHGFTVPAL